MRSKQILIVAAVGLLFAISVPVVAHHAFGAEFDPNRPLILKGAVTKVEWPSGIGGYELDHNLRAFADVLPSESLVLGHDLV